MITLTDNNFIDLKVDLDISEVWNEVRVLLPDYSYRLELQESTWVKIPLDYSQRYVDGASVSKYGRRTRTQSNHVIEQGFGEAYCNNEVEKYKEPRNKVEINLIGKDDTNTQLILAAALSDRVSFVNGTSGLNEIGLVDEFTIDIDLDGIPRMFMNASSLSIAALLDWFIIDTDVIDGTSVIG